MLENMQKKGRICKICKISKCTKYAKYVAYAEFAENPKYAKYAKYADWLKQSLSGSVVPLAMFALCCGCVVFSDR